jgi:hypothetical protein
MSEDDHGDDDDARDRNGCTRDNALMTRALSMRDTEGQRDDEHAGSKLAMMDDDGTRDLNDE